MSLPAVTRIQRPSPAALSTAPDSRILAGERTLLVRDVRRRAAPILALVAALSWPAAELRVLTGFLRTAVLRQVWDEEVLLYPNDGATRFAELSAEHVQLYALTDQLDHLEAASCPLSELAQLVNQTLAVLEHHLIAEQAPLAGPADAPEHVPAASGLAARTQDWLLADDEPVLILLDAPPQRLRVAAAVTLDEVDGLATVISSQLLFKAQINGIAGNGFQRVVDEAAALSPVSRLFAEARISVEALLGPN